MKAHLKILWFVLKKQQHILTFVMTKHKILTQQTLKQHGYTRQTRVIRTDFADTQADPMYFYLSHRTFFKKNYKAIAHCTHLLVSHRENQPHMHKQKSAISPAHMLILKDRI